MNALKSIFLSFGLLFSGIICAQDTTEPWFPGDDQGFYRYLEDRLRAMGSMQPAVDRNGENVVFEFYVTDSGFIDSVEIGQCFNFQLCYQLRQVLNNMPRANATVMNGKTISERRVYSLVVKRFRDGYLIEPVLYSTAYGSLPTKLKWGIAIVAVVSMLILIVK
ncbi:MAG: hypothetical protein IT244_03660 [Bacteroidia bacterium]|nr:hypothetical protein [Bacteroidia bacterium]